MKSSIPEAAAMQDGNVSRSCHSSSNKSVSSCAKTVKATNRIHATVSTNMRIVLNATAESHTHSRFLAVWNGLNDEQKGFIKRSLQNLMALRDGEGAQTVREALLTALQNYLNMDQSFDEQHVSYMSDFVTMLRGQPVDAIQGILSLIEPTPVVVPHQAINEQDTDHESQGTEGAVLDMNIDNNSQEPVSDLSGGSNSTNDVTRFDEIPY